MEYFKRAKAVRLRSQHKKYMIADEDEESVKQSRNGSSKNARWSVEPVDGKPNVIRLKNCQSWKYLGASDDPFLLGMTGKKVVQSSPRLRLNPTVEWEPIREGSHVKLRTRRGNFLRANGGIPPWNNSVTHDVPSRSGTQDWILWTVDILEVDHEASESSEEVKKSSVESVGSNAEEENSPSLSRNSSNASAVSKADYYKDCYEVKSAAAPKSVRSVRNSSVEQIPAPSPEASPKASEKPTRLSPLAQLVHRESKHSDSFNKLKSMLDGLHDLLDGDEGDDTKSNADSEPLEGSTSHHPHPLEVTMAKRTLEELKGMDYETVLSSGRDRKLEKAVSVLVADATRSAKGQVPKEIVNLQEQLKSMRNDHDSASLDLVEYTTFSTTRLEMKAELKKDAAKAHELETLEVGFSNMLMSARAKREALLKQLEEVEISIKATERAQVDNAVEIEELISRIGQKSENLRDMEKKEKSMQVRKSEAERTLERVEEEWVKVQSLFID